MFPYLTQAKTNLTEQCERADYDQIDQCCTDD